MENTIHEVILEGKKKHKNWSLIMRLRSCGTVHQSNILTQDNFPGLGDQKSSRPPEQPGLFGNQDLCSADDYEQPALAHLILSIWRCEEVLPSV